MKFIPVILIFISLTIAVSSITAGETIMNTQSFKAIATAIVIFAGFGVSGSALSAVPALETGGRAAITACPSITTSGQAQVYHSDKIVFMIGQGGLQPIIAADFAALNALPRLTELDIKIRDNPNNVADIKAKVLSFLGAANTLINRDLLKITDVEYATAVCPKAP